MKLNTSPGTSDKPQKVLWQYCIPYRLKTSKFNLETWLRLVRFTELTIGMSQKCNIKQNSNSANFLSAKYQIFNSNKHFFPVAYNIIKLVMCMHQPIRISSYTCIFIFFAESICKSDFPKSFMSYLSDKIKLLFRSCHPLWHEGKTQNWTL